MAAGNDRPKYANTDLERRVLSYFVRYDSTIAVELDYFTIPEARQLFLFVRSHRHLAGDNYKDWWRLWEIDLRRKTGDLEVYKKFLQSLWVENVKGEEDKVPYYLEQLKGYAEARVLLEVYTSSIRQYNEGNVVRARQILEDGVVNLRQSFTPTTVSRADFVEAFMERYQRYNRRKKGEELAKIPTGIDKVDHSIDGTARASLNFIQGRSGIGKTFILMEIGYQGSMNGYKVLFVTVELQRREVEVRWDGRITGLPYLQIDKGALRKDEEALWKKRMRDLYKIYKGGGRLAVCFIPEGCNILSLESEIAFWEDRWNDRIDILVVDYADLMDSTRKTYSQEEALGAIFRDLKRLSQTKDMVVWTASQLSGRGYGKKVVTIGDTGYSMKKNHWANLIIGIGDDLTDEEEGIIRLYISKNTFGPSGFEVILVPDFTRGIIDLESRK